MAGAVKVGPWGASSGTPWDISSGSKPQRLQSIIITSSEIPNGGLIPSSQIPNCGHIFGSQIPNCGRIVGFSYVYVDQKGVPIKVDPWCASVPGLAKRIDMKPGEHLNHVSGTADGTGVTSLTLATNQSKYGPYGYPSGAAFSVPLQQGKGEVVAFFGNAGADGLKALGVYVPAKIITSSPVKVGPWGGYGGSPKDINLSYNKPEKLKSVTVRSTESCGGRVYGFSFVYVDQNGTSVRVGPWGKNKGQPHTFSMNQGEYVKEISGTADDYGVTSLKLTTNQDEYGPFGCNSGTAFGLPLPDNGTGDGEDNGAAVAFFGRSGDSLVAIGAYVGLAPPEYDDDA